MGYSVRRRVAQPEVRAVCVEKARRPSRAAERRAAEAMIDACAKAEDLARAEACRGRALYI